MDKKNPKKILIVDDDVEIVNAIEIYLLKEGFEIIKAYDGLEALEAVAEKEVNLIIMDIMMPKLDGLRATMKIRESKNIPILVISAKSQDYDKILGLDLGADDYITKPFNPLELVARVKSHLRRYERIINENLKAAENHAGSNSDKSILNDSNGNTTEFGNLGAENTKESNHQNEPQQQNRHNQQNQQDQKNQQNQENQQDQKNQHNQQNQQNQQNQLISGDLILDLDEKIATIGDDKIHLTSTEYKILEYLMQNPGKVFSIDQIYEAVWNEPSYNSENTVAVHIRRIREKIEINPKDPRYLKVVWGLGYKIEKY